MEQKKYDGELQQVVEPSVLNPNKLLEVRARAKRNPDQDGYYGKPTGEFVNLVHSWLNVTVEQRKATREAFVARRKLVNQ